MTSKEIKEELLALRAEIENLLKSEDPEKTTSEKIDSLYTKQSLLNLLLKTHQTLSFFENGD